MKLKLAGIGLILLIMSLDDLNPIQASEQWQKITTEALKQKIDAKEEMCLVNVLPAIVHDERHIPGSINIPIGEIEKSDKLPTDKNTPVVFYCMGMM
jgi:rhodanese-related sulfurtransferase